MYIYIHTHMWLYAYFCSGSPVVNQCQFNMVISPTTLATQLGRLPSPAAQLGPLGPPAHLREANCSSWVYEQTRRMAGHWSNETHPTLEVDVSKNPPGGESRPLRFPENNPTGWKLAIFPYKSYKFQKKLLRIVHSFPHSAQLYLDVHPS